jgi:hypothetical protein
VAEIVKRVGATSKVSAVRPLGLLDSLTDQPKPNKKRINKPGQDKDKVEDNRCQIKDGMHIDCNV